MSAIERALKDNRIAVQKIHHGLLQKSPVNLTGGPGSSSNASFYGDSFRHMKQYSIYEGWVYSAVHALASAGAAQEVCAGKQMGQDPYLVDDRRVLSRIKSKKGMPSYAVKQMADAEFEQLFSHPLLDLIEHPNSIQDRWQFVYTFIANLNITGIAFIVGGVVDKQWQLYSLPTSWIRVDHSKGPFSEFYIVDPKDPHNKQSQTALTRDNVAFAMLPNPSDPLKCLAPVSSQSQAVEIDQYIRESQLQFFENGVFPSVTVTIGKNPLPDVAGGTGIRPTLTADQRTAIGVAITQQMQGVYNSGMPVILDGFVEDVKRFSSTQEEMGWTQSEQSVRTRILSAYGVHPFILGEQMAGSYAQAYVVQDRFCNRVNTFLDMLGNAITNFMGSRLTNEELVVWWKPATANDPSITAQNLREAYKLRVIDRDEYRAELGYAPTNEEDDKTRGLLLDNPQAMNNTIAFAKAVKDGVMPREGAVIALSKFLEIPEDEASQMVGEYEEPEPVPVALQDPNPPALDDDDDSDAVNDSIDGTDDETLDDAIRSAKRLLNLTPKATAALIDAASTYRD